MRILLVDDDEAVIQSLLAVLQSLPGHDVRSAITGGQALQAAIAMGGIELLITDVVMEPMDGFTLRDQMMARFIGVKTIFISGYDLSDYPEQTKNHQMLAKPIDPADLLAAVERALAPPAPVAVPVVRAVAAPRAVAVPVARPAAAQPVAQPRATAPAPVARPAQPVAQPTAVPRAAAPVPVARPSQPTARPAQPVAQPTAVPRAAVPQARPAAAQPIAQPRAAAPVPVARPAQPVAQPTAVPRAVAPVPVARAVAPVEVPPPAPEPAPVLEPEPPAAGPAEIEWATTEPEHAAQDGSVASLSLMGQNVGAYQILSLLGEGRWGSVYAAVQTSINRAVGLKVLDPVRAQEPGMKDRFIADARAKAHVQHPSILAVYEAGEAGGHIFYTHEYVDGRNMAEIAASGEKLDEPTALKLLRVACEGLAYYHGGKIPHTALEAQNLFLGVDGHPRLANMATQPSGEQPGYEQQVQALGRILFGVLPPGVRLSPGLRAVLSRMVQTQSGSASGFASWGAILQALKALEPKVIPTAAAQISAGDRAAIAAVEAARKAQKRSLYTNIASLVSLVALIAWVCIHFLVSNERTLDKQIHIPAGDFLFAGGESVNLPDFWIDQHEVTIGQYAKFVLFLDGNPTTQFDHQNQPPIKRSDMHKPPDWNVYYGRAKTGQAIHGVPSDLNMPAIMVDYWDAYAYAKWKGRELPTEQEWEKAARGLKGFLYPWGENFDPKKVNSNADYNGPNPAAPGKVDGFNHWSPVDKVKGDKSPFGIVGMAGNVSEWTGTWVKGKPVIKGGSFMSSDVKLDRRVADMDAKTVSESIGFRTVTHTAPK